MRCRRCIGGYQFDVIGYVVMPEHVHLLLSEPGKDLLAVGSAGIEDFSVEARQGATILAGALL